MEQKPVYVINGFLDSGKTTLLRDTMAMDYFNDGQRTVLIRCEDGECEGCANQIDAFVMEVRPVEGDEETEEFVPVDEKLAEKLIEIFQNSAFDEEDIDAFEDEADD